MDCNIILKNKAANGTYPNTYTINFKINKYNKLKWGKGTLVLKAPDVVAKLFRLYWSGCRLHCSYSTRDYLQHQFVVKQRHNIQCKLHNNKQVMSTTAWKAQDWVLWRMCGHTRVEATKCCSRTVPILYNTSLPSDMGRLRHAAHIGQAINMYKRLIRKPDGKSPLFKMHTSVNGYY